MPCLDDNPHAGVRAIYDERARIHTPHEMVITDMFTINGIEENTSVAILYSQKHTDTDSVV